MKASIFAFIIPVFVCLSTFWIVSDGGVCWSKINKKRRCTEVLAVNITKGKCCQEFSGVNTAWSKDDLDSGHLFFLRVLGGGVTCETCKESCEGVHCGPERRCVMRSGRPKCVCGPCKDRKKNQRGPVCGSDGNNYLNVCRLRKQACRKRNLNLDVAYYGFCQSSCERITCPEGNFCILDQNLTPHCVTCQIRCSKTPEIKRPVCGVDGVTYRDICALRQKACTTGKAIPIAYRGQCNESANCRSVRCNSNQLCLTEMSSGKPRCVTCNSQCTPGIDKELGGPICGTNNKTYQSWCHMIRDACDTGFVIETKYQGICEPEDKTSEMVPVAMTSFVNASDKLYQDWNGPP